MPESKRRRPKNTSATKSRTANNAVLNRNEDPSPTWYVAVMAGLMIVGTLLVLVRFVFGLDQYVLLLGLALIAAGFFMTTNYR
jgi:uncharacterized membrane protein HdeD (DUF308 family)